MPNLPIYETLIYAGIAVIAAAVLFLVIFFIIHLACGAKLHRMLDEEYGDPVHYNRRKRREK